MYLDHLALQCMLQGNNPIPANFAGSAACVNVTLGLGTFSVTETAPAGTFFTNRTDGNCGGTITAGQHLKCTITNTRKTCVECFTSPPYDSSDNHISKCDTF
jgi:hypothetical protein